jgi:hypothetical protein
MATAISIGSISDRFFFVLVKMTNTVVGHPPCAIRDPKSYGTL